MTILLYNLSFKKQTLQLCYAEDFYHIQVSYMYDVEFNGHYQLVVIQRESICVRRIKIFIF